MALSWTPMLDIFSDSANLSNFVLVGHVWWAGIGITFVVLTLRLLTATQVLIKSGQTMTFKTWIVLFVPFTFSAMFLAKIDDPKFAMQQVSDW